jgi:serine protease 56
MILRLGGHDFTKADHDYPSVDVRVSRVIVHEDFDGVTFENDLALLKLQEPVRLTANIVPVCLAPMKNYVGSYATVSGWGVTTVGTDSIFEFSSFFPPVFLVFISQNEKNFLL